MPIAIQEGYVPFRGYQTWYRVTGDLRAKKTPVVILHGGPGAAHDYTDAFKLLANSGRAVIQYDQLGCGRSTHLRGKGIDFWTVRLFLDELENLVKQLGIAAGYHVVGQSWGGMLGAEHGITRPKGLRALVIADSPRPTASARHCRRRCRRRCSGTKRTAPRVRRNTPPRSRCSMIAISAV